MSRKNLLSVYALCLGSILALASCDKIKDAVKIDLGVTSSDITFTIPVLEQSGEATLATDQVYLNIDSIIKTYDENLSASNIKSAVIESCTITLIGGDSVDNLSVLESCKVQFSSDSKQETIIVAELPNNPDVESYTLEIPVNSNLDLAPYFKSKNFSYKLTGVSRRATSQKLECKATVSYHIVAGL